MLRNYNKFLIHKDQSLKSALHALNDLASNAILFVVDDEDKLIGSLTDGDVRRGLLNNLTMDNPLVDYIQPNPRFIRKNMYSIQDILDLRKGKFYILPILDDNHKILNVVNLKELKSYLPLDVMLMAGGRGKRLAPLTDSIPKPLLPVGDKPIIEHNLDNLISYGIDDIWISVKYLGEQIEDYFNDGTAKGVSIKYVWEDKPLGTAGALSLVDDFVHDHILLTNSDLLTNLDYESFFLDFIESDADFSVLSIPYEVDVPYAVLETENNEVRAFKEKPTYTYYSNGGIYLFKKELLEHVPRNTEFNTTDFMDTLLAMGKKVITFPFSGYWLDIGRHQEYEKAQRDILQLKKTH